MRFRLLILALAISLVAPLFMTGTVFAAKDNRLTEEIKNSGLPMVADFGKGQCILCVQQAEAIEEVKGQVDGKITFNFIKVTEEVSLMASYRIFIVPTLIFLDSNGEEVHRFMGVMEADEMRKKIEELGWHDF